jgi:EAL domain-containing protein (putative c-di-GMP-specific phosphodiesterase class I)/GGDEF domain-containing protein
MNAPDPPPSFDLPPPEFQAALKALHRLAQRDEDDVPGRILEMTATTLDVARASLWSLTPGRRAIRCRRMFERTSGMHDPDIELPCDAAPAYFHAIEGLLVLAAEDAQRDPRTIELAASYLEPLGIGAILDVPVCEFGEIVGVLCLEHVGSVRRWTSAERLFVASLSGILSQRHDRLRMAAAEDERRHQLLFDAATGLAGRSLFVDRLAHAVSELPEGHDLAVLALDLERLRSLAHRYGGDFANSVMAESAARIGQLVPSARTGRIADDTFALWVTGDRAQGLATRLANRLQRALALPMAAPDGDSLEFSTAVGIVPGARAEPDADRLLRDALTAAFSAARKGRGRVEVVWPEVRNELQSSLELERDVRRAADAREFTFRLQPIVDLVTGKAVGAEALMRWPRPGGDVPPSDFVPLLEDSGLIAQVHMALLRDLFAWARETALLARRPGFQLHVNFSPVQLQSPSFVAELRDTARAYGVEGLLVCEITENTLFASGEDAVSTLRYLAEMGIPVSLDDFGTGFASLTHLIDLPLHGLKIDRSFCLRCSEDAKARAVVAGLLGLASHLRLDVVAEGVETEAQRALLLSLGATVAQGYLFDRALDLEPFARRWLAG